MLDEIELEPPNELNYTTNYSKNFWGTLSVGAKILVQGVRLKDNIKKKNLNTLIHNSNKINFK